MYNVTIFEHVVQIRAFRSTKQLPIILIVRK
jgi:hypothetical protein